jgi:hypothetical protein
MSSAAAAGAPRPADAGASTSAAAAPSTPGLDALPWSALAHVIRAGALDADDCLALQLTCRTFAAALADERVWFDVCERRWGAAHAGGVTDVRQWLTGPSGGGGRPPRPPSAPAPPPPAAPLTARRLFHLLSDLDRMAEGGGVWRTVGESPPCLVVWAWRHGVFHGEEIRFVVAAENVAARAENVAERRPVASFGPRAGAATALEFGGGDTVALRPLGGGERLRLSPSATAAAAVALAAGSPRAGAAPGTSPTGSLALAMESFMAGQLATPARRRRRGGSANLPDPARHLRRVEVPRRGARRHSLAGLWVAHGIKGGPHVVSLAYDFSRGAHARVVARDALRGGAAAPPMFWAARAPFAAAGVFVVPPSPSFLAGQLGEGAPEADHYHEYAERMEQECVLPPIQLQVRRDGWLERQTEPITDFDLPNFMTRALFRRLDADLWPAAGHPPPLPWPEPHGPEPEHEEDEEDFV